MSRIGVIAMAASVTFIAGIAGGLAIGARRDRPGQAATPPQSPVTPIDRRVLPGSSHPAAPKDDSPQVLADTLVDAPPEVLKVAQELWDMMTSKDSTRAAHTERQARIRDLRPEMAKFFIRKYRDLANATDSSRQYALEMAIACGGPDAAAFVEEIASTPVEGFLEFMLRTVVADVLSQGHLMRRPKEFPVGDSLMSRVRVMLAAGSPLDRRLAVVILGFTDPIQAVPVITERLRTDPDPVVREAAVRELGRIGNEATLALLRTHGSDIAEEIFTSYKEPQPVRGGPPVRVARKNGFLRTLNDAIEELEERLQQK